MEEYLKRIANSLERAFPPDPDSHFFEKAGAFIWEPARNHFSQVNDISTVDISLLKGMDEEIEQVIARVNRKLNRWEQIRKYELVPHPISVETGELTPTMKVKRFAVSDKYNELIESMYQEGE